MKLLYKVVILVTTAFYLSGCGSSSVNIKAEEKQNIKTIAIIKIENTGYQMISKGSGAAAFGALGAVALASDGLSPTEKLNKIIKDQRFSLNKEFEKQLRKQLKQEGYRVHLVNIKRKQKKEPFENFKKFNYSKADAILDVVIEVAGYSTEHFMFSPQWRPDIKVHFGLGRPGQDKLLYSETMMYGYHNMFMSGTDLDAPKKYMFEEEEDVFKAGGKVIAASLKEAVRTIAMEVANRMRK